MVAEEKFDEMYSLVIKGKVLTTKELNNIGITYYRVCQLMKEGIIKRSSIGIYELTSSELMYKKILELLKRNDLTNAFKLFSSILDDNEFNKVILYLFNIYYYKIPDELKNKLLEVKNNLYIKEDTDYSDYYNNIILNIIKKKYNDTLEFVKNNKKDIKDELLEFLLEKICKKNQKKIYNLVSLARSKEYALIYDILKQEKEKCGLNLLEECILLSAEKYLSIRDNKIIPEINNKSDSDILSLISSNNFALALQKCIQFNEKNDIQNNTSVLYMILNDINILIKQLSKNSFTDIIRAIESNSLSVILDAITSYLKGIGKEEYSSIMLDYLKIDLLKHDTKYMNSKRFAQYLEHDNFGFYITSYIKQFYLELGKGNIEIARAYLDILENGDRLGYKCPIISLLDNVLEYTTKLYAGVEVEYPSQEENDKQKELEKK